MRLLSWKWHLLVPLQTYLSWTHINFPVFLGQCGFFVPLNSYSPPPQTWRRFKYQEKERWRGTWSLICNERKRKNLVTKYFWIHTTCIFPWIRFPPCDIRYKYLMTNLRYTFSYKNKKIHKPFFVIENLLHYIFLSRRKCILPSNHICVCGILAPLHICGVGQSNLWIVIQGVSIRKWKA